MLYLDHCSSYISTIRFSLEMVSRDALFCGDEYFENWLKLLEESSRKVYCEIDALKYYGFMRDNYKSEKNPLKILAKDYNLGEVTGLLRATLRATLTFVYIVIQIYNTFPFQQLQLVHLADRQLTFHKN